MKRTAKALVLLAGFGGGCATPDANKPAQQGLPQGTMPNAFGKVSQGKQIPGLVGPTGEPVVMARGATPGGMKGAVEPALFRDYGTPSAGESTTVAHVPGITGWHLKGKNGCADCGPAAGGQVGHGQGSGAGGYGMGGGYGGYPGGGGGGGILPVPGQGAPGAVAGYGALVPGMGGPGAVPNGRASVNFIKPAGMKVTWQLPTGGFNDEATGLTVPKDYNYVQGQVYRLRLTQILPGFAGKAFYPTLEIASGNPKTVTFLAHTSIPISFENEDFAQAAAGNLVVKVIYLPDRDNQDFATVAGALGEVVSTQLEPGADPVAEAQRRGTILAIIRLGNIDLENRASPAMTAPPGSMLPPGVPVGPMGPMGGMLPPGGPGFVPGGPGGPRQPLPIPVPPTARPGMVPGIPAAPTAPGGPLSPGALPPGVSAVRPSSLPPVK